jgi:hypothetical protein
VANSGKILANRERTKFHKDAHVASCRLRPRRCHRRVASARADLLTMRARRADQERHAGEIADRRARRAGRRPRHLGVPRSARHGRVSRVKGVSVAFTALTIFTIAEPPAREDRAPREAPRPWESGFVLRLGLLKIKVRPGRKSSLSGRALAVLDRRWLRCNRSPAMARRDHRCTVRSM